MARRVNRVLPRRIGGTVASDTSPYLRTAYEKESVAKNPVVISICGPERHYFSRWVLRQGRQIRGTFESMARRANRVLPRRIGGTVASITSLHQPLPPHCL